MTRSVQAPLPPMEVQSIARTRQSASGTVNRSQSVVGRLIGEAMRRTEGGQRGAAATLRRDEGQLSRELLSGALRIRDLDDLSDALRAEVGRLLLEQFGDAVKDPRERAKQLLPQLLEQLLEAVG